MASEVVKVERESGCLVFTLDILVAVFVVAVVFRSCDTSITLDRAAGQITREVVERFTTGYTEARP